MNSTAKKTNESKIVNGIDTETVSQAIQDVAKDPSRGLTRWSVVTRWEGGARTLTQVDGYEIGGQYVKRSFQVQTDEPFELGGTNLHANPQETLMAGLNSCMAAGYAILCALEGIELEDLRIETSGEIDLSGFFGLDPNVKPGYDEIQYKVTIKGNGTPEQFQKIHERVTATSPNRFNIANPIRLRSELVVA
jgi:uncharacterized OsmC-like protein